jgi:hypothetical protein
LLENEVKTGERRQLYSSIPTHPSPKPTPTPPQQIFLPNPRKLKNLKTVEKLFLKPLNNPFELLQSYQSKKLLSKPVENGGKFQHPGSEEHLLAV